MAQRNPDGRRHDVVVETERLATLPQHAPDASHTGNGAIRGWDLCDPQPQTLWLSLRHPVSNAQRPVSLAAVRTPRYRSEKRRVGKECRRTCSNRGAPSTQ